MNTPTAPESTMESASPHSTRLNADDWARAALELIAEQGVAAVAVEPLARRLGVTKGSFYWHFRSRNALLQAALERWEKEDQEVNFTPLHEHVPDPRERIRTLMYIVAREYTTHVIYAALIKAASHPVVRPVIERVSQRRLDYLVATFRQAGLGKEDAPHRARLVYTAYVGFLQLNLELKQARMSRDEFNAYIEHVVQTLLPP